MYRYAAVLSLALGCSTSSGGFFNGDGGASDAGPTFDDTLAAVAKAYCERAQACAPARLTLAYGDVTTCQTRFTAAIRPTLDATGVATTPDQLRACAQALPSESCADFLARKNTAACKLPAGTLADGAPCTSDLQCVGSRCGVPANQVCGTCRKHAPSGGSCVVDDDCDDGLGCVGSACTPFGNDGDACDATHPCRADLGCKSGKCGAPSSAGTACTSSAECDGLHGIFCGVVSKQCDPVTFDSPNQACGIVAQHLAVCVGPGGYCAGLSATKAQGTCEAPAADGAACDTLRGPLCNAGAACVCVPTDGGCAGTCTLPDPRACH